jgi:hypothetical protein
MSWLGQFASGGETMKTLALSLLVSAFALGSMIAPASAQSMSACEAKAVSKNGKPLSGAAKTSAIKKCMKDTCESQAVDKTGKKLAGAAKTSFFEELRKRLI